MNRLLQTETYIFAKTLNIFNFLEKFLTRAIFNLGENFNSPIVNFSFFSIIIYAPGPFSSSLLSNLVLQIQSTHKELVPGPTGYQNPSMLKSVI